MIATCKRWAAAAACLPLAAFGPGAAADPAAVNVAESPPAILVVGRSPLKLAIFRKSRVAVPTGDRVGDMQDGDLCSAKGNIQMAPKLAEAVTRQANLAYRAEMSAAGYPAAADTSLFEEKPAGAAASDFDVGATIRGMQLSLCRKRGILSGQRTLNQRRFLQSDVAILSGSSGGPLLDASGTVIGITVAGVEAGRANLNLFIPIREALDKLTIELKD
jgi:Trypsin-like peptidase domain